MKTPQNVLKMSTWALTQAERWQRHCKYNRMVRFLHSTSSLCFSCARRH